MMKVIARVMSRMFQQLNLMKSSIPSKFNVGKEVIFKIILLERMH
jgi:hypothetical protein